MGCGCPLNLPGIGETPGFSGHAEASLLAMAPAPMMVAAIAKANALVEKIVMEISCLSPA
jgi:hypothetical protein